MITNKTKVLHTRDNIYRPLDLVGNESASVFNPNPEPLPKPLPLLEIPIPLPIPPKPPLSVLREPDIDIKPPFSPLFFSI